MLFLFGDAVELAKEDGRDENVQMEEKQYDNSKISMQLCSVLPPPNKGKTSEMNEWYDSMLQNVFRPHRLFRHRVRPVP